MSHLHHLVLASASPRRQFLLSQLGYDFEVRPTDVDESLAEGTDLRGAAEMLALRKNQHCDAWLAPGMVILCADSAVLLDDQFLGKPETSQAAQEMLQQICGRTQLVVTGVCLSWLDQSQNLHRNHFSVETEVTLAEASLEEIDAYILQQPPLDRAGSYGIQDWIGLAKAVRINGSYTNVMGLPTAEVYQALKELGMHPSIPRS